jgi:hypothetical protein
LINVSQTSLPDRTKYRKEGRKEGRVRTLQGASNAHREDQEMPGSIDISGKSTATAEPDSYGFIRMDGANTVIAL